MDPSIFNNPQSPAESIDGQQIQNKLNDAAYGTRFSNQVDGKSRNFKTEEASIDYDDNQSAEILGSIATLGAEGKGIDMESDGIHGTVSEKPLKTEVYKEDELPPSGVEATGKFDSRKMSERDDEHGLTLEELTIINEALGFEHNPLEYEGMTAKLVRERQEKRE